jgi:lysophospholipase L1-like esterase
VQGDEDQVILPENVRRSDSSAFRPLFWGATLLVPVLVFVALELLLRAAGLFEREPLFRRDGGGSGAIIRINTAVGLRYFDPQRVAVPMPAPEAFAAVKGPTTFRVFCLGESTTAGFPFDCQVPFPRQLQFLLNRADPGRTFEVINTGISAMSSTTVLDLLPEILDARPDLLILYLGHNEFYGAYGAGSADVSPGVGGLSRFMLRLQRFRVVGLVSWAMTRLGKGADVGADGATLMGAMVHDADIPVGSEPFVRAHEVFRENYRQILAMARDHGVPVLASTIFSNVVDQPPMQRRGGTDVESMRGALLAHARQMPPRADAGDLVGALARETGRDSTDAEVWFAAGRSADERGDSVMARACLYGAKERDALRFRASEEINRIIREVGAQEGAFVVDMQAEFARRSRHGLIGSELLSDHLHPNPEGYFQMARTFAEAMQEHGLPVILGSLGGRDSRPIGVTPLDWDIGQMKVFEMTHRWPFQERPVTWSSYVPRGDSVSAAIALRYLTTHGVWSSAHYAMAAEHLQRGRFEAAREEYLAVNLFAPRDPFPLLSIAGTYEREEQWREQEDALREASRLSEKKGMILYRLAMAQARQHSMKKAAVSMEEAAEAPEFTPGERENALFYAAGFHADAEERSQAIVLLKRILSENPGFTPAKVFLLKLGE